MKRNVLLPASEFRSSFLSCEKDIETILRRLFIESKPYSDLLKRLLVINTKDCLDNEDSEVIEKTIQEMSLAKLIQEGYIKLAPKITMPEHEEVKSYIIISMDNFSENASNPYYRDCTVSFDILCHTDYWDIGNYRIRPLKIAGYIDGLLNHAKLSGIGTFDFIGCNELVLNEDLSGYTLSYRAIHGNDDKLPPVE
jgi:hypothetical protein